MKTSFLNQRRLPLVVEFGGGAGATAAREAFFDLALGAREFLRARLLEHGAVLLRGGPVLDPSDFGRFVREFSGAELFDYVGGASPRVRLCEGVYTSTEYPHGLSLSLHNELSYSHRHPSHLYFCCVRAADTGGETPLADSRRLRRRIDEAVVREFGARGIKYVRNLHGGAGSGYSWQEAFETGDRRAVEDYCRAGRVEFAWRGDGGLTLSEVRPALATHGATGEEVWFNQAEGFHPSGLDAETYRQLISEVGGEEHFRLNSYFGDGAPLPRAALEHVREAARAESVPVAWRPGDVLILDNLLTAHGRMPFTGQRRILLAMT